MDYSLIFDQLVGPSIAMVLILGFSFTFIVAFGILWLKTYFSQVYKDYVSKSKEYDKYLTEYVKLKNDLGNANHEIKFLENQLAELRYGTKQNEVDEK